MPLFSFVFSSGALVLSYLTDSFIAIHFLEKEILIFCLFETLFHLFNTTTMKPFLLNYSQ